jgi:hypothetical protein
MSERLAPGTLPPDLEAEKAHHGATVRPTHGGWRWGVGGGKVAENLSIDGPQSAIARLLGIIVDFSASTAPPRPSLITFPDYVRRIKQPSLGSLAIAQLTVKEIHSWKNWSARARATLAIAQLTAHGMPQSNRPTRPQVRRPPPYRPRDEFARSGALDLEGAFQASKNPHHPPKRVLTTQGREAPAPR